MPEAVKKYIDRIKEFWNKYTIKQRTIFIASVAAVIIALVILGTVLARPQTVVVRYCSSAAEAVEVRELLTGSGINCTVGSSYEIIINEDDEIEAQLILGSNNYSSAGYSLSDALNGGFSQTESDKEKLYKEYLEKKFAEQLTLIDGIRSAQVNIDFKDTGSTIFTENKDSSITAILITNKELSAETVEAIGLLLANNVGSQNTNNVTIMDNKGNLLYTGLTDSTAMSSATTAYKFKRQLETDIKVAVQEIILSTRMYSEVQVMPNLSLDNDLVTEIVTEYQIPDGSEEGLKSTSYEVDTTGNSGASGVAGTESNDSDTDYLLEDGTVNNSAYSLKQYDWLQNSKYTTTEKAAGTIKFDESSLSATFIKYNVQSEEDLRLQGLLEDMTYEEYKLQNSEPVALEVDQNLVTLIANGTGIAASRIAVAAYQYNVFLDTEESSTPVSFIIQIVLAVLIVALLLFVVFRSARPVTVSEVEPELSVEDMLASTREQQAPLEDIDLQDKSEARKAIEKFVQENPEAVALLLRNWLNEGWE